ncbi:transcription factor 12-like [Littorina saxatilis]|uniref:transcription factor 12-like n=1 Tax=Littorina saxatilis TaxID=31220 RepID=UPI0038B453B7
MQHRPPQSAHSHQWNVARAAWERSSMSLGQRMNVGDKELSDLLDFSAMFSPPVGGGSGGAPAMKGGPPNVDSSQIIHQGYRTGVNNGEAWNNGQPGRVYEGQYNGTSGGESIEHFLGTPPEAMPGLMNKSPAEMYSRSSGFSSPAPPPQQHQKKCRDEPISANQTISFSQPANQPAQPAHIFQPTIQPTIQPACPFLPANQPANQPASQPASPFRYFSQPANQQTNQTISFSQPASQPASQPTSRFRSASQPASPFRYFSQPANQPTNQTISFSQPTSQPAHFF